MTGAELLFALIQRTPVELERQVFNESCDNCYVPSHDVVLREHYEGDEQPIIVITNAGHL